MYTDFNKMPSYARVWVYQANVELADSQVVTIKNHLQPAVEKWAAHGTALLASMEVLHNRFIVIALDETKYPASGCSIDASTRWFKELAQMLNIDFFDRSLAYLDGENIKTISPFQVKQKIAEGVISADTFIYLNNILTLEDLSTTWKNKAVDTYLKRYFVSEAVS